VGFLEFFLYAIFSRDTSLLSWYELIAEPIDKVSVVQTYDKKVRNEVGISLHRRDRHKFSRGSLAKRSFRFLIKPKVFTI
jgi:hypothetical protein